MVVRVVGKRAARCVFKVRSFIDSGHGGLEGRFEDGQQQDQQHHSGGNGAQDP